MHGDVGDPVLDLALARQEGGADAPGLVRQAQVQAGRLNLIGVEGGVGGMIAPVAIRVSMDWQGRMPGTGAWSMDCMASADLHEFRGPCLLPGPCA